MSARVPAGVLLQTRDGWRAVSLGGVRAEQDLPSDNPSQLAAGLLAFFNEHRLRHDQLIVAINSASTLMTSFPVADLAGARDRQTITFRLESALPLDAESIAADYQFVGENIVCLAASTSTFGPVVEALEAAGLQVQSVVTAIELVVHAALKAGQCRSNGPVLVAVDDGYELLTLKDGIPVAWRRCTQLIEVIRAVRLSGEERHLVTLGLDEETTRLLEEQSLNVAGGTRTDIGDLLRRGATRVLRAQRDPWFELRRGRLAEMAPYRSISKSVRLLLVTLAASVMAAAGVLYWRASLYEQQLAAIRTEERELFKRAFPESPVPRAVLTRLRSEHAKVLASRRETADVPAVAPALQVLRTYLSGLPLDVRCQTSELGIDDGELTADVRLNRHEDAGAVADSLQLAGFEIDPPTTTQQEDRTINSRMTGRWAPKTSPRNAPADSQMAARGGVP